jgi:hypothetical protein
VADVLAEGAVNVRALALADMAEFGILRLGVDDTARARDVLKAAGFTVNTTPVIAVGIPDSPGGMAAVLRALGSRGLEVEYLYAFARQHGWDAVLILRVEDQAAALAALREKDLRVLEPDEVHGT